MLLFEVKNRVFKLNSQQVRQVHRNAHLIPFVFKNKAVEGVVSVDGQCLIQIDLALALGFGRGRGSYQVIYAINDQQALVLRVDGLVKNCANRLVLPKHVLDLFDEYALPIQELLRQVSPRSLQILLLDSGSEYFAVLAKEVKTLIPLSATDQQSGLMMRDKRLLTTYCFGTSRIHNKVALESSATNGEDGVVLLVADALRLMGITQFYQSDYQGRALQLLDINQVERICDGALGSNQVLWFLYQEKPCQLISLRQLKNKSYQSMGFSVSNLPSTKRPVSAQIRPGLLFRCASYFYWLPAMYAIQVYQYPSQTSKRHLFIDGVKCEKMHSRLGILDVAGLLGLSDASSTKMLIQYRSGNGFVLLAVDQLILGGAFLDWRCLTLNSSIAPGLDALIYSEHYLVWCVCIGQAINFSLLPFCLKKRITQHLRAWCELEQLTTI